jgi:hypothetical protein
VEDYRQAAVVLTGDFNPAIFHPDWFQQHEILPEIEVTSAQSATDVMISHQVTIIRFLSLRLEVLGQRWTLSSERSDWFKDLGPITMSIFQKLPHTPVKTLSINFSEHRLVQKTPPEVMRHWLSDSKFGDAIGEKSKVGLVGRANWDGFETTVVCEHSLHLKGAMFLSQSYEKKLKTTRDIEATRWGDVLVRSNDLATELLGISR